MPKSPQSKVSKANATKAPKAKKQILKRRQPKKKTPDDTAPVSNSKAAKLTKSG